MSVRILAQSIYTQDHPTFSAEGYALINDGAMRVYRKVLQPDTVVDARFVPRSTYYTSHTYLEMLNNAEIVRGIIAGEAEGYDAAFVRCGNDPGIIAARESVSMPVIGIAEAAMHLACQPGARFALIGVDAKSIPLVERNLRAFGLEGRAIANRPVRVPEHPDWYANLANSPRWFADPAYLREHVVPAFEAVARECIADGAEVIVTACALYSSLSLIDYRTISGTAVPVVESVAVGAKQAEMMAQLYRATGLSTSKHLTYQGLAPELREQLAAPFL